MGREERERLVNGYVQGDNSIGGIRFGVLLHSRVTMVNSKLLYITK